jgi:uncharacterized protein
LKLFIFPVTASGSILLAALVLGGLGAVGTLATLGVLEMSLSFDNSVVNSVYLQKMNAHWQKIFLTLGILVAVFGMRLLFPLIIVSLSGHLSMARALDLAVHDSHHYARVLAGAHNEIATFGAVFLGMIFLDFITEEREVTWLGPLERFMALVGKLDVAAVAIMLILMALVVHHTLFAGILALAG